MKKSEEVQKMADSIWETGARQFLEEYAEILRAFERVTEVGPVAPRGPRP